MADLRQQIRSNPSDGDRLSTASCASPRIRAIEGLYRRLGKDLHGLLHDGIQMWRAAWGKEQKGCAAPGGTRLVDKRRGLLLGCHYRFVVAYRIGTCAPRDVEREVASLYEGMFPRGDPTFVGRAFEWLIQCFDGSQPGYQAIDLRYHDLEHTMQGTLCLMRLLQGYRAAKALPEVSQDWFELALLAILFHDTGYLKRRDDTEGTGAKYTAIHVGRSAAFAREFVIPRGYSEADADAIENMIRCTGVATDLGDIPFRGDTDRVLGFALATADLLGQMAAPDYVEKLPALFEEFAEAARAGGETAARFAVYTSAEELRRRTPGFWEHYVWPRINLEFLGLHRFLNHPYPEGPNPYVQQIERNIARVRGQLVS